MAFPQLSHKPQLNFTAIRVFFPSIPIFYGVLAGRASDFLEKEFQIVDLRLKEGARRRA